MLKINFLFMAIFAAVLVGCSGNGQTTAALDETEASASIDITYCRAHWCLTPDSMFIKGSVATHFKSVTGKVSTIDFDLMGHLQVDSVVSHGRCLSFEHSDNKLIVNLPAAVKPSATDSVAVYYHGELKATGLGSIGVNSSTHSIWTISEPYSARDWWPARQNLLDKIDSMDIVVNCPAKYKVATNGLVVSDLTYEDRRITHYHERHPLNYYTIGVAVGDYAVIEGRSVQPTGDTVPLVYYHWLTNKMKAKHKITLADSMLMLYSDYFSPYPFADEKYGQVVIGGEYNLEHQTMSFLAEPDNVVVLAHELTHQWFGNYVTCKGWSNIWINEGFATFGELLALEHIIPHAVWDWHDYTINNALQAKGAIYVTDTTSHDTIFDEPTTYRKGAMVVVMLRSEIGEQAFQQGCRMLLERYGNGFATVEDARQCFEQAADTSLAEFFKCWIYGTGYPQFTVDYDNSQSDKTVIDIQQAIVEANPEAPKFFPMHITVRLVGKNARKDVRLHLTSPQQQFVVESDFKVNNVIFDPNKDILGTWCYKEGSKHGGNSVHNSNSK